MDVLILIGRILFAILFLMSAVGHFMQTDMLAGYAESKGVRPGKPLVLISGLMILLGGLSVLLGIWPDLGALLLFLFLVPAAFLMHAFWKEEDQQAKAMEQVQFLKDLSLAGAALMLFVLFQVVEVGFTITGPLFDMF